MSAQSQVEKALRELHVLLSRGKVYEKDKNLVIVDKKKIVDALNELNQAMYEVLDEHECTKRSRDQAEREVKKRGEELVKDANRKAEDVYAASVLYTDEALKRVQEIMQENMDSVKALYDKMQKELEKEKRLVRTNQLELKSSLQDLRDTDKYLQLIEEQNKKLAKENAQEEAPKPVYTAPKPEIRVNEAYFREHGLSLEPEEEQPEEKKEKVTAEISVNLDSEYFKWKERKGSSDEIADIRRPEKKPSLFKRR